MSRNGVNDDALAKAPMPALRNNMDADEAIFINYARGTVESKFCGAKEWVSVRNGIVRSGSRAD